MHLSLITKDNKSLHQYTVYLPIKRLILFRSLIDMRAENMLYFILFLFALLALKLELRARAKR
ncbi:hypothetical protein GCM10011501_14530 [Thalassotalea profundi]|uniref:Uncharacterized protein n=1 Tax=Thalassotalea profundi TaxID=2036687 RepID=A0ABQ3INP5_9GAMM|nr:hypothetical protein GCM10011501_14530 [Thalassotalea profundi]